ncbi:MAG: membrane dipeptidase [Solobacterium sp.]|nr:membrane dipeptidase [Solobacterium sp.]
MKVFDLHADLAIAIGKGSADSVLKEQWHERFKQGEVVYTSAASFFRGDESWEDMQQTVRRVKKDIELSGAQRILDREDLKDDQKDIIYLMTAEGMCGIKDDPEEKIQWLYDQGNRIGSLEWNDENALATGNWGDPARGLTGLGRRAVKKMNELHMIVDVSHANEKTFWDILDASELPVIATHSNAKKLCFVERNLTDQQMRALASKGGLIGMNACASFIHEEKEKRTAENLAAHARYIADLVGVSHVACGFDFGAYYKDEEEDYDIYGPEQTQNFINGLRKHGFSEEEIEMIAWKNVLRFLREYML